MKCNEEGCDRKVLARGMCAKHYQRWDKARDPERFHNYNTSYRERNRERILERRRAAYAKNPKVHIDHVRRYKVKQRYGLSLEEYESIIARGCAICGRHGPRMSLDHNHANGKIRDALCASCNNGLGRFQDDPSRLRAAANYLEKHS